MVTVWLQASPAEGNRATLLRGPQSGRQRSHVLPGQKQISGSQLVARQVPGTDWQGSGWGRDLGGREKWREVLQGRWQWAGVWLGEGSVPQFHSHRLLPHPIIKPEKRNKTKQTSKPDPDSAGFDTHQPSWLLQKPTPSLRSWVPTLSSLSDPAWSPSLNCHLPLLPSPYQPGNPSCAYSTLFQASASGSGSTHSCLF